jgi:hypothetical protein
LVDLAHEEAAQVGIPDDRYDSGLSVADARALLDVLAEAVRERDDWKATAELYENTKALAAMLTNANDRLAEAVRERDAARAALAEAVSYSQQGLNQNLSRLAQMPWLDAETKADIEAKGTAEQQMIDRWRAALRADGA